MAGEITIEVVQSAKTVGIRDSNTRRLFRFHRLSHSSDIMGNVMDYTLRQAEAISKSLNRIAKRGHNTEREAYFDMSLPFLKHALTAKPTKSRRQPEVMRSFNFDNSVLTINSLYYYATDGKGKHIKVKLHRSFDAPVHHESLGE
jgi:hypothetical protein